MNHSALSKVSLGEGISPVGGVILLDGTGSALLQLRDDKPGLPEAGKWVFPGGHCNAGEPIEECARREFLEETAYACGELHYLTDFMVAPEAQRQHLTFFWHRFDEKQALHCLEGMALQFISRDKCPPNTPEYLPRIWDLALAAAEA